MKLWSLLLELFILAVKVIRSTTPRMYFKMPWTLFWLLSANLLFPSQTGSCNVNINPTSTSPAGSSHYLTKMNAAAKDLMPGFLYGKLKNGKWPRTAACALPSALIGLLAAPRNDWNAQTVFLVSWNAICMRHPVVLPFMLNRWVLRFSSSCIIIAWITYTWINQWGRYLAKNSTYNW